MSRPTEILVAIAAACVIVFAIITVVGVIDEVNRVNREAEIAEIADQIGDSPARSTVTTRPSPYPDEDIVGDIYASSDCEWLAGYADDVSPGPADPWDRLTELVVAAARDRMNAIDCQGNG